MMAGLAQWMGTHFSPEQYLFWTRIQCILWTGADLAIVYYLLRLANLGRRVAGASPHRIPFAVLALTALGLPFIALANGGWQVFAWELLVTVPHFLLIVYVIIADFRMLPRALAGLLGPRVDR